MYLPPVFAISSCRDPVWPPFGLDLGTQTPSWQQLPLLESMGGKQGVGRLCSLIGGVRLLSGGSQVPLPSQGVQIPLSTDGQGDLPNYQIKPSKHDVTPSILEGTFRDPGLQCLYFRMHSQTRDGCFQSSWDGCIWGSFILSGSNNSAESGDLQGPASQRSGWDEVGGIRGACWHPIRVCIW